MFICFTIHAHKYRASYVLREGYKPSYGAIAKIFGISQDTVAGESTGRSVRLSGKPTPS
jgi:transposase